MTLADHPSRASEDAELRPFHIDLNHVSWQDRIDRLSPEDRAEAMRQLGELTVPARVVDWSSLAPAVQRWWLPKPSGR